MGEIPARERFTSDALQPQLFRGTKQGVKQKWKP
jgi:hypothetical protein